jgi:hypothetical protein
MWALPVSAVLSLAAGFLLRGASDPLLKAHARWQRLRTLRSALPGCVMTAAALFLPDQILLGVPERVLVASLGFAAGLFLYPAFQFFGLACLLLGTDPDRVFARAKGPH